jgi:glycosyltransferase involved in cell wall biosynthesis
MHIFQIHNDYQQVGGETITIKGIAEVLLEGGNEVTPYWRYNSEIPLYSWYRKAILPVNAIYSLPTYFQLRSFINKLKPEVAHVHHTLPLLSSSVYYALQRSNVPIVQHLHSLRMFCANGAAMHKGRISEKCLAGNYSCAFLGRCFRHSYAASWVYASALLLRRLFHTYDIITRFIAISRFIKDKYISLGIPEKKITVLYNFVDFNKMPLQQPHNERCFVYIGRLSEEKGVRTLVQSFARNPDLMLKIVGDGPERKNLEKLIADRDIRNVTLCGHLGEERFQILSKALACIVPSECYEAFGRSVAESFACAIPVIASRLGALPEFVRDGENGWLFRAGDVDGLSDCLRRVSSLEARSLKEMGNNGYAFARENFSKENYLKQLLQIYDQAVDTQN